MIDDAMVEAGARAIERLKCHSEYEFEESLQSQTLMNIRRSEARAALEAAMPLVVAGERAWRLIESAPKDGTTIFGRNNKLAQRGLVHFNMDGKWEMVDGLTNYPNGKFFEPTHWLPEPKLPAYVFATAIRAGHGEGTGNERD